MGVIDINGPVSNATLDQTIHVDVTGADHNGITGDGNGIRIRIHQATGVGTDVAEAVDVAEHHVFASTNHGFIGADITVNKHTALIADDLDSAPAIFNIAGDEDIRRQSAVKILGVKPVFHGDRGLR